MARNEKASHEEIGRSGFAQTARSAQGVRTLLAVEDTTELSYLHEVKGLDDIAEIGNGNGRGVWAHSTLLLNADDLSTVGLIEQRLWVREAPQGKRHLRRQRAYADKESFKWQSATEVMRERLGEQMKDVISICDREADIYDYLSNKLTHSERVVVRAARDRLVLDEDGEHQHLLALLDGAPQHGKVKVDVTQRGGRRARQATLTIRATTVELKRPRSCSSELPPALTINVVLAREEKPPKGVEPLEWVLLTTESIASRNDVKRILEWYRCRWRIEVFHKVWKTGAGVERLRMHSVDNLQRMAVILAFVAVRLMQLREHFDHKLDVSVEEVLSELEWKMLWITVEQTKPPRKKPTSRWAYHALGKLGGWADTKSTGIVGWEALWSGWAELRSRVDAHALMRSLGKL